MTTLPTLRRRLLRWLLFLGLAAFGVLATIVLVFALQARMRLPALQAWHRVDLENEFHAARSDAPRTFEEYRRLEDRLFAELRRRVLDDPRAADTQPLGRYTAGSIPARLALETPYNHSYELVPDKPAGAVLLVHGLSDSPYSMRSLAETFFARGFHVVVLRLPGHGTVPSSLRSVTWQDWYAAVTLAAKYAADKAGTGHPFLVGGHSTGAALVTLYTLRSLDDASLSRPDGLYLLSAAIGITDFAALTNVVGALSFLPYFEKSQWIDVLPEYDPYKYNSFPVNAGNQIYRLTREVRRVVTAAGERGRLDAMPPVLAFQSLVDSTVTASQVVRGLLAQLPPRGHELVVFDVNRRSLFEGLMAPGPLEAMDRLREAPALPFRLTVVSNRDAATEAMATFTREAGGSDVVVEPLPLEWPVGVFSLGHVALPIAADDPVYGLTPATTAEPAYRLGTLAARGEDGALLVSLGALARLRCNPFFDVIRMKVANSIAEAGPHRP